MEEVLERKEKRKMMKSKETMNRKRKLSCCFVSSSAISVHVAILVG